VVLQSSIEKMRNYNPNATNQPQRRSNTNLAKYNVFKSFVESVETSEDRRLYVLPDIYHRGIREGLNSKGSELIQEYELFERCVEWYKRHTSEIGFKGLSFKLLTSSQDMLNFKKTSKMEIVSIVEFLRATNSNLLDFVGFSGQDAFFSKQCHEEHLSAVDSSQAVRQGTLFEGKFMAERSYLKLAGSMVKLDLRNNRALFGDIVTIELDPR
jgi:hypothetical protein